MAEFEVLKAQTVRDPNVEAAYDRLGPVGELVGELVEARHRAGLTQVQLAARMGTSQPAIARLESARHMLTLDMAARYAEAVGQRLDIHLRAAG